MRPLKDLKRALIRIIKTLVADNRFRIINFAQILSKPVHYNEHKLFIQIISEKLNLILLS